jgi:Xaa-Pro aminopeptidase
MPDTERRLGKLRALLKKDNLESLLVTNFTNVTYLTGFTGDDSYLLVTADNAVLLTDSRYTTQLEEECPDLDCIIRNYKKKMMDILKQAVTKAKVGRVGVESDSMTLSLRDAIAKQLPKVELAGTSGLVERLREIKDAEEIDAIRVAVDVAEKTMSVIKASLRPEQTEKQIAADIEHQIRMFGGTGCSFTPIVGVGPRGALPHAPLSEHCVGEAPTLLIDWGALTQLYMSDLTRVFITGKISPKVKRIYDVVYKAQRAAINKVKPGVKMCDIDKAARSVIEKAGFGKRFGHGLGHGIGQEIHEAPRLAITEDRPLKAGMVITIEPGIYIPGLAGVRIEDDILVTRNGHEVLSTYPRDFESSLV